MPIYRAPRWSTLPPLKRPGGTPTWWRSALHRSAGADPAPLPEPAHRSRQVIEELIQLARDMREAAARGERLGLINDEPVFYDALQTNDSACRCWG